MSLETVRSAYTARATEYIDLFGTIEAAAEQDRGHLLAWARAVRGRIVDVGCGPGQWTGFLHENGVDVEGVDPVPAFVEAARRSHPGVAFRVGDAGCLDADDASLGGVLAWYSLIHTAPTHLPALLEEFARCIRPGGSLLLGFFLGPELTPFDHAVTTAYFWPVDQLTARVEEAGFTVSDIRTRVDAGVRPQGTLIADRCP
ncbi:class I SAM-dependent methyltransferase [Nocardioides alcanivorans]|uniref:class I SAM-dependent methyltransferase n=1 Tax=Nocardioides alcanivorans TaxID=2897352 RepID=UPI001F17E80C|nr:class I SAM-dependent methyltransferase [Nocardioides alcanivorans]